MTETNTTANTSPIATPAPAGAVRLGDWTPEDDPKLFASRTFHGIEHTTPGGVRVRAGGLQYADGTLDELGVEIIAPDGATVDVRHDELPHLIGSLAAAQQG